MKEERIEVDSDICEYCEYFCSEPKKCVECEIYKNINNFRGIECIKLTDEKEKNIELKELIEESKRDKMKEINNIGKEEE